MNALHETWYKPQGLPLFPKIHPVGVGRKHLMHDDFRQYNKPERPNPYLTWREAKALRATK